MLGDEKMKNTYIISAYFFVLLALFDPMVVKADHQKEEIEDYSTLTQETEVEGNDSKSAEEVTSASVYSQERNVFSDQNEERITIGELDSPLDMPGDGEYYADVYDESARQVVIDGKKYFIQNGENLTGWYTYPGNPGWRFFLDPADNGAAVKGAKVIDGAAYLFNEDCIQVTNSGTPTVDGKKYYVNVNGTLVGGWITLSGMKMYFDPTTYAAKVGISDVEGKKYYFDSNAVCYTEPGMLTLNGKKYWIGEGGVLKSGWLEFNNWTLYFKEDTYEAATEYTKIGNKYYLFDSNGVQFKNIGISTYNGRKYWINNDYSLSIGWQQLGDWTLYFFPDSGYAATDLTKIEDKNYLFDANGVLFKNVGTSTYNGRKYWVNNDYSLSTGWQQLGGWTFYFLPDTGYAATDFTKVGDKFYLFDSNGVLFKNVGTSIYNGRKYWINNDYSLCTGWQQLGDWILYFDKTSGAAATEFAEIDGKVYYFTQDGIMQKGLQKLNGYNYYFYNDGHMAQNEWVTIDGGQYYFEVNGKMKNEGQKIVDYACQFIGNPYVWGGNSLTKGTDCSGFVHLVYAYFGYSVPRQSNAFLTQGTAVSYSEAQPGDVICYQGHVAIYMGDGKIVHAANEKLGITTGNATYNTILSIRRFI